MGVVQNMTNQVFSIVAKIGGSDSRARSLRAVIPGDNERVFNIDFRAATNLLPDQENWFPNYYSLSGTVETIQSKKAGTEDILSTLRVTPYEMKCLGINPAVLAEYGIEVAEVNASDLIKNSTSSVGIIYPLDEDSARAILGEDATPEGIAALIARNNRKFRNPLDGTMPGSAKAVAGGTKSTTKVEFS